MPCRRRARAAVSVPRHGAVTRTEVSVPLPWSAQSREDFPDPLRPMTAVTSPECRSRSTPGTATHVAGVTDDDVPSGEHDVPVRGGDAGPFRMASRRATRRQGRDEAGAQVAAARRASRTDSGSGDHPAYRPSSTTGEVMSLSTMRSAGGPERTAPSAETCTTVSA